MTSTLTNNNITQAALEALKKPELVARCKVAGIKTTSSMRKDELVRAILNGSTAASSQVTSRKFATDLTNSHGRRSTRTKAPAKPKTKQVNVEDEVLVVQESEPEGSTRAAEVAAYPSSTSVVDELKIKNAALRRDLAAANASITALTEITFAHETKLEAANIQIAKLESLFFDLQRKVNGLSEATRQEPFVASSTASVDNAASPIEPSTASEQLFPPLSSASLKRARSESGSSVATVIPDQPPLKRARIVTESAVERLLDEDDDQDSSDMIVEIAAVASAASLSGTVGPASPHSLPSPWLKPAADAATAATTPPNAAALLIPSSTPNRPTPSTPTPVSGSRRRSAVVVPPPTPPAPRTMFGTERETDTRFEDQEPIRYPYRFDY